MNADGVLRDVADPRPSSRTGRSRPEGSGFAGPARSVPELLTRRTRSSDTVRLDGIPDRLSSLDSTDGQA